MTFNGLIYKSLKSTVIKGTLVVFCILYSYPIRQLVCVFLVLADLNISSLPDTWFLSYVVHRFSFQYPYVVLLL